MRLIRRMLGTSSMILMSLGLVLSSTGVLAQATVEPIPEDDMVDYLAKALVVYATHQGDAWICGANREVQQCAQRLQLFDEHHFPMVDNPVMTGIVRNGSGGGGKGRVIACGLKLSSSLQTFRQWGDILAGDESKWDSGIASVRKTANVGGCSSEEIAYFDQLTGAAIERAENVLPRVKSQQAKQSASLEQCKASAAYKRFDAAASIPNLRSNLSTQESYLDQYQRTQPTTVREANKLRSSIANENQAIAMIKQMLAQKSSDYVSLGGNLSDSARMTQDASMNPCAALGDDWQHDLQ